MSFEQARAVAVHLIDSGRGGSATVVVAPALLTQAGTTIATLIEAIEAGGMVAKREPVAAPGYEPLRELRSYMRDAAIVFDGTNAPKAKWFREQVRMLNRYFPEGDKL